jgi:ribonuclease HI
MNLELVVDGSAMPSNPGPMAIGMMWHDRENAVLKGAVHQKLDHGTNNIAEYTAVLEGLKLVANSSPTPPESVIVWCDSQLVVRQLTGVYRVNNAKLRVLKQKIISFCGDQSFEVKFKWHRREEDWAPVADALSKGCTQDLAIELWTAVWQDIDPDKTTSVDLVS